MTTLAIQTLLDNRVAAITAIPPIQEENTVYNASGALSPWVRTTLLPAASMVQTIGVSATKKMSGLYQVDCFFPKNQGSTAGRSMADAVVAAFPIGTRLTDGTVTVIVEIASVMTTLPAPTATYVNFPVQVKWTVYE